MIADKPSTGTDKSIEVVATAENRVELHGAEWADDEDATINCTAPGSVLLQESAVTWLPPAGQRWQGGGVSGGRPAPQAQKGAEVFRPIRCPKTPWRWTHFQLSFRGAVKKSHQ